ncbi:MAG: hypothetical protein WC492_00350 [Candidatus Micrarchaeia archaeon]
MKTASMSGAKRFLIFALSSAVILIGASSPFANKLLDSASKRQTQPPAKVQQMSPDSLNKFKSVNSQFLISLEPKSAFPIYALSNPTTPFGFVKDNLQTKNVFVQQHQMLSSAIGLPKVAIESTSNNSAIEVVGKNTYRVLYRAVAKEAYSGGISSVIKYVNTNLNLGKVVGVKSILASSKLSLGKRGNKISDYNKWNRKDLVKHGYVYVKFVNEATTQTQKVAAKKVQTQAQAPVQKLEKQAPLKKLEKVRTVTSVKKSDAKKQAPVQKHAVKKLKIKKLIYEQNIPVQKLVPKKGEPIDTSAPEDGIVGKPYMPTSTPIKADTIILDRNDFYPAPPSNQNAKQKRDVEEQGMIFGNKAKTDKDNSLRYINKDYNSAK